MSSYGARHGDEGVSSSEEAKEALLSLQDVPSPSKEPRTKPLLRPTTLFVFLCAALLLLLGVRTLFSGSVSEHPVDGLDPHGAAYKAATGEWASAGDSWSPAGGKDSEQQGLLSNGTHPYQRTVLLVSLDGVRADYLTRGLTPNLLDIAHKGIHAAYLESIFPTLTFPNHWSILTGLYAESHGIVGNDFYDPSMGKDFLYQDPAKSWAPEWWQGEPLWARAERQGVKSAVLMWPGPPALADGLQPSRWYAFEDMFHWRKKTDLIERWLDLPLEERPRFIAAYLPEVDQDGHRTGPHSQVVADRLLYVDEFAKSIHDALETRNLLDIVDVFFVSDHGMTETSNERLIYLDDLLGDDYAKLTSRDGWPSAGLRFEPNVDSERILAHLEAEAAASDGSFSVFTASTMPAQWHFSHAVNERIAPIYVVPAVGWSITHHDEMKAMEGEYKPVGNHGYDPSHPDMHAIFVAHGPWARSVQARGQTPLAGFKNIELYNLFARLLDIEPASTNGTAGFWDPYFR